MEELNYWKLKNGFGLTFYVVEDRDHLLEVFDLLLKLSVRRNLLEQDLHLVHLLI